MERKKDLAKIALAAFILAATTPLSTQALDDSQEIFLAVAGCPAHGCPAETPKKGVIADNSQSNDAYNARRNSYQTEGTYSTQSNSGSSAINTTPGSRGGNDADNYSSPLGGYGGKVNDHNGAQPALGSSHNPSEDYGVNNSSNRQYHLSSDDYERSAVTTSSATLTEAQLLGMLTPQGRAIYLSLDPEGKALAIQLASQETYRDKNLAVKESQRRMNERRH